MQQRVDDRRVSLSPLTLEQALSGLLKIPDPAATKPKAQPKKRSRKKPEKNA